MNNPSTNLRSRWSTVSNWSGRLLAGSLAVGTALIGCLPVLAAQPENSSQVSSQLPDGVYLYGQSSKPEQIGQGYFVFEVNQGNVVGALYMPRSSFDCASGTFQNNQLALTVVNSYDRTTNPYENAVEKNSTVASRNNPTPQEIGLQGFHRLPTVSENDQRILNVCKADFQKRN
ncbi:hypothetical protein K9N68_23830 [Kovacikia minuta CCNUW1]|uniref:hypothetical protein n=1 Tax=Kovacikia minuta TaxID=2931930 RepID=UPI001CC93260|nr:hypothetical protein [Kovacikia minuta]UBF24678.1 hypothetical protein K9N68_23830 [Kovacikia minuta CCNUW1]